MGKITNSKIQAQEDLEKKMNTVANMMSSVGSSAPDGSYTKATLGGAATGATIGTSLSPGWGTLVGAVVGAGAGAIGNAVTKKQERENKPDDSETRKTLQLQNDILQQKYNENRRQIDWATQLRNKFKYR